MYRPQLFRVLHPSQFLFANVMAEVNAVHDASRKRKRRKNRKNKQQPLLQGYYVDPRSPIASTPMKRQRTKAAGTAQVAAVILVPQTLIVYCLFVLTENNTAKQVPRSDASNLDDSKFKEEEKFFSPRKLLAEYDEEYKEKKPGAVKARTKLNYDLVTVSDDELEQKQVEEGEPDGSKDGLFSPALKPPRTSRSTSASPPSAQGRLNIKLRLESVQPDNQAEHSIVLATEVIDADVVDEEEHEEEDGRLMEQEFNPYGAT